MPSSRFPHDHDADHDGTKDPFDAEPLNPVVPNPPSVTDPNALTPEEKKAVAQEKRDVTTTNAEAATETAKKAAQAVKKDAHDVLLHQQKEQIETAAIEAAQIANDLREQSHRIT